MLEGLLLTQNGRSCTNDKWTPGTSTRMRVYVITEPGGPAKLELMEVERPSPRRDWVLLRNRAFGLNRFEWFTRRGDSPIVSFPRVLGIERVGEAVVAPGGGLHPGQTVAAMMGGMAVNLTVPTLNMY